MIELEFCETSSDRQKLKVDIFTNSGKKSQLFIFKTVDIMKLRLTYK